MPNRDNILAHHETGVSTCSQILLSSDCHFFPIISMLRKWYYNAILFVLWNFLKYYKNTFRQGVSNDRGSHVETSSICAIPLGEAEMCTRGSQAQPLLNTIKDSISGLLGVLFNMYMNHSGYLTIPYSINCQHFLFIWTEIFFSFHVKYLLNI